MTNSPARILLLAGIAASLSACHDNTQSRDAMYAPENVLQAPLFSEDNRQFENHNAELHRKMIADSMYHVRRKQGTDTDSAGATPGNIAEGDSKAGLQGAPMGDPVPTTNSNDSLPARR